MYHSINFLRFSAQAQTYQGLLKFKGNGKQCMYNALASLIMNENVHVKQRN